MSDKEPNLTSFWIGYVSGAIGWSLALWLVLK